ncbi:hypothetical protein BDV28DRAFT_145284 [Aspergillus coremiiformis]|uniref:Uncharacterized protein n=1 Tax=Aspergillus coremiiformis TaxID=138285 RepID=A0A5N6ZI07_9EURO|nr:hypothetical protein BDV28DRAFT_145284 [Aspergillus coremiiformis]
MLLRYSISYFAFLVLAIAVVAAAQCDPNTIEGLQLSSMDEIVNVNARDTNENSETVTTVSLDDEDSNVPDKTDADAINLLSLFQLEQAICAYKMGRQLAMADRCQS